MDALRSFLHLGTSSSSSSSSSSSKPSQQHPEPHKQHHQSSSKKARSRSRSIKQKSSHESKHLPSKYFYTDRVDLEAALEVALLDAAKENDAKVAAHLLFCGAWINYQHVVTRCTALHVACANGSYDVVQELIKHPVNLYLQDGKGKRAVEYAISNGHRGVIVLINLYEGGLM